MTMLGYRPELAIALADESPSADLADNTRDELSRIAQQMRALVTPLTRVRSLTAATEQAASIAPEYINLAMQWGQARLQDHGSAPEVATRSPMFDDIHRSEMIPEDIKENLYGALESSMAYFSWLTQNYKNLVGGEMPHAAAAIEKVGYVTAGAEAALLAIGLTLRGTPESAPQAIPVLAELADRCWTEVEDVFLSLAEYDDDGETVPLSEVKAELGL